MNANSRRVQLAGTLYVAGGALPRRRPGGNFEHRSSRSGVRLPDWDLTKRVR